MLVDDYSCSLVDLTRKLHPSPNNAGKLCLFNRIVGPAIHIALSLPYSGEMGQVGQKNLIDLNSIALVAPISVDQQKSEGFRPRNDCKPWPLSLPLDWSADPFQDRNWAYQLHAWRMMDPLLKRYRSRPSAGLLEECLAFAVDWYDFHVAGGREAAFTWNDMATGLRAMRLAFLLERLRHGDLSAVEGTALLLGKLADIHVAKLTDPTFIARSNHGLYQMAGLGMLAAEIGDDQAEEFSEFHFMKLLRRQYTNEGVHRENSPDYHFLITRMLAEMRAEERFGGEVADIISKAKMHRESMVFPDGSMSRAGDSASVGTPPAVEGVRVDDLTASGYASVRTHDSMLFVTGMAHEKAHKHADELSFQLFHKGRFIFVDSGKYGYQSDSFRRYVTSAAAHNTIGLCDRQIGPKDIEMSGSLLLPIEARGNVFRIEGSLRRPGLFEQRRVIEYRPGESVTITDHVRAHWKRSFVSSLHLAPDLEPVLSGSGFKIMLDDGSRITVEATGADEIDTACGQHDPLLGWYSPGYLQMEPTSVVRAIRRSKDCSISWKISFE